MSFSVHAKAFVPSSGAALAASHLCESSAAGVTKDCVCVAFYENGRCPYGNHCEHAHCFSELTQSTQVKLLGSMPVEFIPPHFFGTTRTRGAEQAGAATVSTAAPVSKLLTAFSHHTPSKIAEADGTVSTRRRPLGKDRHLVVSHIGPQTPPPDLASSLSSRTSSSEESQRLSMGTAQASKSSSSASFTPSATVAAAALASAAAAFDAAAFKLHLPLRCRYPHRAIPGTYYDVLALPRDAPHDDIIAKYRAWQKDGFKRMRIVDPVGAEAVDRMIVEARNVLGNPALRAAYDQQLPKTEPKQHPWSAAGATVAAGGAGTPSTITTPSKRCTQGQSSTTSSASETHYRQGSSIARLGYSSSSSSMYHADVVVPVVTISGMRGGDSIW